MVTPNSLQETPFLTASLASEYAQFTPVTVPTKSGAESAWIGEIQPFSNDNSARAFLHDIEAGRPIFISNGRIRDAIPSGDHWADPLLVGMHVCCKVLVLVMPAPAHPRSYLLSPFYPAYYVGIHPHPRGDQLIVWNGKPCPGLCIYSAPEFEFDQDRNRNAQYLDQLTLYVARHLIWLRTRKLYRGDLRNGVVQRVLRPGENLPSDVPRLVGVNADNAKEIFDYWAGYWPGPVSGAMNPVAHLASIRAKQECWCGSGKPYGECHRESDKRIARSGQSKN